MNRRKRGAPAFGVRSLTRRLAFNLLAVRKHQQVGVERFVRNVVGSISVDLNAEVLLALRRGVTAADALGPGFLQRHPNLKVSRWLTGPTPIRIMVEMFALSLVFFSSDVILSVNNFGPLFGKRSQRRITVIHDVWFLSDSYEGNALTRWTFFWLLRLQLAATDRVITVSEFSKREIIARLGVAEENISVIPNCLAKREAEPQIVGCRETSGFFLLVGSDRRNKNVLRTVRAYAEYVRRNKVALDLVLVGQYSEKFKTRVAEALPDAKPDQVRIKGYVGRPVLARLYAEAKAVVFPSLYEGYGIPVIEALSFAKPVLVSSDTVCEELAGNMGVVVDGGSVASIASGFERLAGFEVDDPQEVAARVARQYMDCSRSAELLSGELER